MNKFSIDNELDNYYGDIRILELLKYNKKGDYKCIYCYEKANTREHLPSKIFLNEPYLSNLAILPACYKCNNTYSNNEQYLACLIDYVESKLKNSPTVKRSKIEKAFKSRPHIKTELEKSTKYTDEGKLEYIEYNYEKVKDIILKLSIGHATYSLSRIHLGEPDIITFKFLTELTDEELNEFNKEVVCEILPELGSRGANYIAISNYGMPLIKWDIIQNGQYRFLAYENKNGMAVRIVIGEFFYSEVIWNN